MCFKRSIVCALIAVVLVLPCWSLMPAQAQDAPPAATAEAGQKAPSPSLDQILALLPILLPVLLPDAPPELQFWLDLLFFIFFPDLLQ